MVWIRTDWPRLRVRLLAGQGRATNQLHRGWRVVIRSNGWRHGPGVHLAAFQCRQPTHREVVKSAHEAPRAVLRNLSEASRTTRLEYATRLWLPRSTM